MISVERLNELIQPVINDEHLVLCDTRISGKSAQTRIQLFIDFTDRNITIDECVRLTRDVKMIIDLEDDVPGNYHLEVSSPGLDFPLRQYWQFSKNIGRRVQLPQAAGGVAGRIAATDEVNGIDIEIDGERHVFPLDVVRGAHIIVEMPKRLSGKPRKSHKRTSNKRRKVGTKNRLKGK